MALFPELETPALLIERGVLEENLADMQTQANNAGVKLRPHVKTHKSAALARRQLALGAQGIAVAKISEAESFARHGIVDIQIANQVVGESKIRRLVGLAERMSISCAIDSHQGASDLSGIFAAEGRFLDVFIEIDTGLHRCGLYEYSDVVSLGRHVSTLPGLRLVGILTHAGHAYGATNPAQVRRIGEQEGLQMVQLANRLRQDGLVIGEVSVGSTPTARNAIKAAGVTELRAGNYIFNDLIQVALGTVPIERCALTVLATVISIGSDGRVVVDAGSKSLSSDAGAHGSTLVSGYGRIVGAAGVVERLSEEHGILRLADYRYSVGDRLRIIPNHACPVANLFARGYLVDGSSVVETIEITARGCSE